jgi:hypothetical protein
MAAVWNVLVHAYAVFAVAPPVTFALVLAVARWRTGDVKRSVRAAMDVTTAFLIGAVAMLINSLTGSRFGLYLILLIMLVGAGLMGGAQARMRGEVDGRRLARAVWRISFLALSVLYIVLMIAYLIAYPGSRG